MQLLIDLEALYLCSGGATRAASRLLAAAAGGCLANRVTPSFAIKTSPAPQPQRHWQSFLTSRALV